MLNLDRVRDPNPYVERLHQGFAFLTGRLQQKLDDELPELTEGLVSLLRPHYLRMIASLSVAGLLRFREKVQRTEVVSTGSITVSSWCCTGHGKHIAARKVSAQGH